MSITAKKKKRILLFLLLLLIAFLLIAIVFGLFGFQGHGSCYHFKTYEQFVESGEYKGNIKIPRDAHNIDIFALLMFDTNHWFIKTHTDMKQDFFAFVDNATQGITLEYKFKNIPFQMDIFNDIFPGDKPKWWDKKSLPQFEENYLIIRPDESNEYGKGIWYFYDRGSNTLLAFEWTQQWLMANDLKEVCTPPVTIQEANAPQGKMPEMPNFYLREKNQVWKKY